MKIKYLINGAPFNPVNRGNIYLEINHDQGSVINSPAPHVGINNLYFAREDVKKIMTRLSNSPGITEGAPLDIELSENGASATIQMYIDLMEDFKRSVDGVQVTVKMLQSLDWMDDKVDAFTYESMYNEQGVTPFMVDGINYTSYQQFFDKRCIYIPYVISTIPNWHDAFLAIFGITYVGTQIYQTFKSIVQWSTPIAGFGLVVGIAQLALEVVFMLLLLATLIALITQLIACLIQPLKYHGAMLMSDMLKITAVKLGLQSQSSIWDSYPYNQIAYMPEKYNPVQGGPSVLSIMGFNVDGFGSKGYTAPAYAPGSAHTSETPGIQHGYFNGTGGDFLRMIKKFCNGKIIIPHGSNSLVLERRDYYPASTPFQLKNIRQDWNTYNTDELSANIIIKFLSDLNERNSIDHISSAGVPFFPGTILQATHQQVTTMNQSLVCLKGLREIQIPAARGVAKDRLTFIEKAVSDLEIVWHGIELLGNVGVLAINVLIVATNLLILTINILIFVWNAIITVLHAVTEVINVIIDVVNTISVGIADIPEITVFDDNKGHIGFIGFLDPISFISFSSYDFSNRLGAWLFENDIVDTPKLLLVDTSRTEYLNNKRIGYAHSQNASIINALNLWNKFYFIDRFAADPLDPNPQTAHLHNRFTKISPALNHDGDNNKTTLSLKDFLNLVYNPQFTDNWGEKVIADSIQWHIENNGAATFSYRKSGWLADAQHTDAGKRAQEINLNLSIKISTPNGQ